MGEIRPGAAPVKQKLERGKAYFWCACGRSQAQPLCDGSHKGSPAAPLKWIAEKDAEVWLCTCKKTARPPFCDGSHKRLAPGGGGAAE